MMNNNPSLTMFEDAYLASGGVTESVSAPVPMQGNKVAVLGQIIQISGTSPIIMFEVQGSYDGTVWDVMTSVASSSTSPFGPVTTSQGSVAYGFIRVAVRVFSGSSVKVLYNVTLTFSAQ